MTVAAQPDSCPKTIDENFIDWEAYAFGFGYGSGEPHVIPALKRFFELCPVDGAYDYEVLEATLSPTVSWLLINILANNRIDVLEYGTSPRFAWLTGEGKALKQFLATKTDDELVELVAGCPSDYFPCCPHVCNCGPDGFVEGARCHNPFWRSRP